DAGLHHQKVVVEHIGAENDEARRLLVFLAAAGIDIANRLHLLGLPVVDQFLHIGMGAQLETVVGQKDRQDARLRRGFGVGLAAEALAVTAIFARAQRYAFRIGVGGAHVGSRRPERVISQFACGLLHDGAGHAHGQRFVGILVLARPLEHVAAIDLLAAQIAGLAGHAEQLLEAIVVGLKLVVGDRKIR